MVTWGIVQYVAAQLSEVNAWTWLCVFAGLLFLLWRRRPHPRFPPGPRGLPVFGIAPFMSNYPHKDFKKWSMSQYGPVMSVRLGFTDMIILNTFDAINNAFVKKGVTFSDRPWIALFCTLTKYDGIIFKRYGDQYKMHKAFAVKFIKEQTLGKTKMESIVNNEADAFVSYLKDLSTSGEVIDLKEAFNCVTANVVSQTAFGKSFEYGEESFNKLMDAMNLVLSDPAYGNKLAMINVFGFLANIPPFSGAMHLSNKRMSYIMDVVREEIAEHEKRFDPKHIGDFIDAFLYEQKHGNRTEQGFTDIQLVTVCRDLFVAGTGTTAMSLAWFIVYMLNYPEYEELIEREVLTVLGSSGIPTMAKRPEMPFTCAFIQEVERHQTMVPLAVQHMTLAEVEIDGFVIPKGTPVMPNIYGAHMDPETWPEPHKFDPRRHIDSNGKFVNSNKIIPFSIGSRYCLGDSVARMEFFIIFVKIVQKFNVRCGTTHLPQLDNETVSTVVSPQECLVRLEIRN